MKMHHVFVAIAAAGCLASSAGAVVRFLFTGSAQPYGLTNPALAFQPTMGQQQDAASYQVAAFPPLEAWGEIPAINWPAGEFAYVWVRFHNEADNRKLQGLRLDQDGDPADVAYYIMNDLDGPNADRRWDGAYTMPDAPEFRMDPQILAAVSGYGIRNRATDVDAWNLYDHVTRTALLGAVRYDSDGVRGVVWHNSWPPSPIPPPWPPPWTWESGQVNWIPEPATCAVAMLLCAAFRRSRRSGREM